MKRLLLFLVLFSSSLLILWAFVMDEGDEVVVPPPKIQDDDPRHAGSDASGRSEFAADPSAPERSGSGARPGEERLSGAAIETAPATTGPGIAAADPIELAGSPGTPAGVSDAPGGRSRPGRPSPEEEGFEATDLEQPIETEWKNEDGTTRKIAVATIRLGHVKQEMGTNRLLAEDVSFTFFDRTPRERPVATGTSEKAVLFTEGEINQTLQNIKLRHDCVLKDDVKVTLLGENGANTDVFADILYLEENRISSPAVGEHTGRVRIKTDTMEIAGTEMEIDLAARTLFFKKDIRIDGTDFVMPDLVSLEAAEAPGEKKEPSLEGPIVITCGGPFLFSGTPVEKGELSDRPEEALLGSGTLTFEGGVTASRGDRKLVSETMTMRFDKGDDGRLGLVSMKAESPSDGGTSMDADFGQLLCRALLWDAGSGPARSRMVGSPVIENLRFGAFPGQPERAEDLLYRITARDEIALDMIEGDGNSKNPVRLTLIGGGRIEPMSGSDAGRKAFFLEGDAVESTLVAADVPEGAGSDRSPGYLPSEIRIKGRARVQMDGMLEADEIVMTLGSGERGSRLTVNLIRNAALKHEAFWLESEAILIRIFSDGLTDISTDSGFALGVSLDAFSGTEKKEAAGTGNEIAAEGDRSLRLWWPGEETGGSAPTAERRALKIEGNYTIHVKRPGQEKVVITGKKRFNMGTGQLEGVQLTTLRLVGSPHVAMYRAGVEEMSLDCDEATIDLDHNAPLARDDSGAEEKRDEFGPVLSHRTKAGFFTRSLVRKIVALREVRLCYGSRIILCDSIEWDLPADLLVADGAGRPVQIVDGLIRTACERIEINPEAETIIIIGPRVLFPEGR